MSHDWVLCSRLVLVAVVAFPSLTYWGDVVFWSGWCFFCLSCTKMSACAMSTLHNLYLTWASTVKPQTRCVPKILAQWGLPPSPLVQVCWSWVCHSLISAERTWMAPVPTAPLSGLPLVEVPMGPGSLGSLGLCPSLQVSYLLLNESWLFCHWFLLSSTHPPLMGSSKTLICCAWCSNDDVFFGLNFIHVTQNSWLTPHLHMTWGCHRKTFPWTLLFGGCWMPDSISGPQDSFSTVGYKGLQFHDEECGGNCAASYDALFLGLLTEL